MNPTITEQSSNPHVALHLLIRQLAAALQPEASTRNNTLVNEISPCLLVRTNPTRLSLIIRQLLETVNHNSRNSFIRLSAKIFGDVLLIHVKKKCPQEVNDFSQSLAPLQQLASELYGNVSITSHRNNVTTVALSFINQPVAA